MQFINLKFKNLFSFGDEYTELDLSGNGITFVKGLNKDDNTSNGSGKSTIPNIFVWALYGKPLKNVPADYVVNKHTGSNAHACIEFLIGENHYEVNRYREDKVNGNAVIVKCNGVEIENGTLRAAQAKLDEILGVDYNSFISSTIFSTEVPFQLPHLSPTNRREYLENILGLKAYSEYGKTARSIVKAIRKQADGIEIGLKEKKRFLSGEKGEYETYLGKVKSFKTEREEELSILQAKIAALNDELGSIDITLIEGVKSKIKTTSEQLEAATKNLSEASANKVRVEGDIYKAETTHTTYKKGITNEITTERKSVNKDIAAAEKRIELIQCECPTCNRDWEPEEVKTLTELHNGKIEKLRVGLNKFSEGKSEAIEKATAIHLESMEELENSFYDIQEALKGYKTNCDVFKSEISEYKVALEKLPTKETYENIETRIKDTKVRLSKKEEEENPYVGVVEKCETKILGLITAIDNIDKEKLVLEEKLKYTSFWDDSFNNDGLKLFIFESIIPLLNSRIAYYVPILFGEKKAHVEFDTMMNMYVNVGGKEVTYANLSQGERKRIDLALSLSMLDTAQAQFGTISNVMFFDELLDGSLDTEGVRSAVQILQSMPVDSIFLVSHRTEISNEFDNVLEIVKENNISKIVR